MFLCCDETPCSKHAVGGRVDLGLPFQRVRVHGGRESAVGMTREQKPEAHIWNQKHKAEGANPKWQDCLETLKTHF